jgi:phosphoserine phosphatase RsbU/P
MTANLVNLPACVSLVFLDAGPDLNSSVVRAALRADILRVAFGILLLAVACSGIALFRMYRRKDSALLWFCVFAGLYGLRLLASTAVVPFMAAPVPRVFWSYLVAGVSYTIAIPITLFLYEVLFDSRRVLRWLLYLQTAFAVVAIRADQVWRRPDSLHVAQNVLVLGGLLVLSLVVMRGRGRFLHESWFAAGLLIFLVAVVLTNIPLLARHLSFQLEPIGLGVFLTIWGFALANRIVRDEERLIEIRKELAIAREIQMSILPRELPRSDRLNIEACYLPMTEVAGDFYDFLIVDPNHIGVLIADVSGHGVPAALIASMIKMIIAAQLRNADDPARIMTVLNQALCGRFQGHLVTAAYLYLDLQSQKLTYSAAGHPPLLWFQRLEEQTRSVEENGLLLGVMPEAPYSSVEREINPGDRLLLYTDGVLEAENKDKEAFGEKRIQHVLHSAKSLNARQFATLLLNELAQWTGSKDGQNDDLTLVIIDFCAGKTETSPS